MSNSDHSNNTFCNALEQNVTLVQNNNGLVTHVVNTYPKRIQRFIKTAFNINVKEQRPFSCLDFTTLVMQTLDRLGTNLETTSLELQRHTQPGTF